ncbi:MAG: PD-(D/E)XK nuclease family protein [Lachnospiraceae bacterium]|nr:PD-(D/E)XK nuclease family protein [Lachnospiraceae bacterium]
MSLQFVLGPSGGGKSHYIYEKIIKESMEHPELNYILLVPEQYSLALQRKMVLLHPNGGTLNIDVIGFNRLAYRVFDELNIKTNKVLEDFGKSMLVRRVAGEVKEQLKVYKNCLNKKGFVDEVKSLMSEFYQYDFSVEELRKVIADMKANEDQSVLLDKLQDMEIIVTAFQEKIASEYIVAEQLTELLRDFASSSELIKNSVIVMDGFTGFTPIQLKLIGTLICNAVKVYSVHTIDEPSYKKTFKGGLSEHELFYLTDKTLNSLKQLAREKQVPLEADICVGFYEPKRWSEDKRDLLHLEKNIFRYPYDIYNESVENITLNAYQTPRTQLKGVAEVIFSLVKAGKHRYKDIAIVSGNFEKNVSAVSQIFPLYDIPYFLDYTPPIKNNACIDSIGHVLRILEDDFSYDSVFSFLKSGVVQDISYEDVEELENYVLAKGIKGYNRWNRVWKIAGEEINFEAKDSFLDVIKPFKKAVATKKAEVANYTKAIRKLMETLEFADKLKENKGLYEKLLDVLDKLENIMGEDCLDIREFIDILEVGLKELNLGMIPSKLDMVLVGDITRTRLDNVKVLFIIDANEGVIPSNPSSTGIITEKEKEKLQELGVELAPTDKVNSFVEQLYLYSNMTAPSDKLYISYTNMNSDNKPIAPSYVVDRLTGLFTKLRVETIKELGVTTAKATREYLVDELQKQLILEDFKDISKLASLYEAYKGEYGDRTIAEIHNALAYSNVPEKLRSQVTDLIMESMMKQSVSKLEQYAKCPYSYFLRYTLGIDERELYKVDDRDTGNILHTAMESMFSYVRARLDNNWDAISEQDRDKLLQAHIDVAWEKELGGRELEGGRYDTLKEELYRIGKRTIAVLSGMKEGNYLRPELFEEKFNVLVALDEDKSMQLRGKIDRTDVLYSSEQDSLRYRVVDYKSSNQDIKLNKIYDGVQLQLAIYTGIMKDILNAKTGLEGVTENTKIIPEGMYYYGMEDPYINVKNEADVDKERAKKLKLYGLENKNSAFDTVIQYADKKAKDLAMEILNGNIAKTPLNESRNTACTYCPYSACCRFDEKYGGNSYKFLKYGDRVMDTPGIINCMEEELGINKKEVDADAK